MSTQVASALAALRELGTPGEIRALADRGGRSKPLRTNTHIHLPPNFSAFDTIEQAVALAAEQQIAVLGVSNYYDYDVYGQFADRARGAGIFPLFGLEIMAMQEELRAAGVKVNDPGNPGKTYLCGKGITRFAPMSDAAKRLINVIRRNDSQRMAAMIDRLRTIFQERGLETNLNERAVIELVERRHGSPRETVYLQERHVSQAFQEALFERVRPDERLERLNMLLGAKPQAAGPDDHVAIQNDIRSHLMKAGKAAFVDEAYLSFEDAQRLVLELGGIPSYPVLADGASPICAFEADADQLISKLQARNVYAVEWIPIRNSVNVVRHYVTRMRDAGFMVTAGTEHNTLDLVPFDPYCKDGAVPDDVREIFCEGAYVVAAHQFLTLHGERGFVDAAGTPNAAYGLADERIRDFARIGAAVIERYHATCAAGRHF